MDATYLRATAFIGAVLVAIGCGQSAPKVKKVTINGQDCSEQAQPRSFLVEWKEVPPKYQSLRIHPQSNITRFKNIDKDVLEKTVLKENSKAFVSAEHEFKIKNLGDAPVVAPKSTCNATVLPSAWGPADIQASQAWNLLETRGAGVTVAVVDSGTEISHSLLRSQIWTNSGEVPGNGIDDDHNGYIDDRNGFDFQLMTEDLSDESNHGTHVAGIIAGQPGSLSFVGVAPAAQIMPLKFIDGFGAGSIGDAIAAMEYATQKGARVINASWGGAQCSDLLKQEITKITLHGTVFVNAAGNDGNDISNPMFYEWPAVFQIPGKITVGSMNSFQFLSLFSNYGQLVDLAAPGEAILSTVPPDPGELNNKLCTKSGTSMATPFVSGVAALLLSARPQSSTQQILDALNYGVVPGHYGVRTAGKLNALKAAQYLLSH